MISAPACLQKEHEAIRSTKGKEEPLTPDDYRKMEYTSRVSSYRPHMCGQIHPRFDLSVKLLAIWVKCLLILLLALLRRSRLSVRD